jgi:hypothetical protein
MMVYPCVQSGKGAKGAKAHKAEARAASTDDWLPKNAAQLLREAYADMTFLQGAKLAREDSLTLGFSVSCCVLLLCSYWFGCRTEPSPCTCA